MARLIEPMEKNRINFGKLQIFSYVESTFTCVSDLLHPELDSLMNLPGHGLKRDELMVILHELFECHFLVASQEDRGLFTPSLNEIESALDETNEGVRRPYQTFYGLTSAANDTYSELKAIYGKSS